MPKGKRIEPLDLDELESSPTLAGMLAFREVPAGNPANGGINPPICLAPIGGPPVGLTQRTTSSEAENHLRSTTVAPIGAPPTGLAPTDGLAAKPVNPSEGSPIGVRDSSASSSALQGDSIELADILAELVNGTQQQKSRGKLIRAERVEDGHSATQNNVYWHLWRSGRQVKGSRSRFIQAGYGQLQAALGIDRSNIQDAIRDLQRKLSIQIVKPSTVGSATIYEVFSCEDILVKRRAQGLIWVRKFGTRRADFVTEDEFYSAEPAWTPMGLAPTGGPPAAMSPPVVLAPTDCVSVAPTEPIGVAPIHSVKGGNSNQPSTSSVIVKALFDELGAADDDAAGRIARQCRENAPDASDSEIAFHIRKQAQRIRQIRGVENPVGVLIAQVPRCFKGEAFRQFREQEQIQQPKTKRAVNDMEPHQSREVYVAILADPASSENERRVARLVLEADSGTDQSPNNFRKTK